MKTAVIAQTKQEEEQKKNWQNKKKKLPHKYNNLN